MRSTRSSFVLRKIGGVFDACRTAASPFAGTWRAVHPSIGSTALSLAAFLLVPLMLLAVIAAAVAFHPAAATVASASAVKALSLKLTALGALPFAGEIETVSNELVEKREEFATKQRDLGEIFKLAKDGPRNYDFSRKNVMEKLGAVDAADAFSKVQQRNMELDGLGIELQNLEAKVIQKQSEARESLLVAPAGNAMIHPSGSDADKSFGQLFVESKAYAEGFRKNRVVGQPALIDIGMKTLFQTSAGYAPQSVRSGLLVEAATRPIQILDFIPTRPIDQAVDKYMEETVFTPGAAETAEGTTYQEAQYTWAEQTSPVQKLTDSVPVTDEQLEDAPAVAGILDQRLRFGLRQKLDGQAINGSGTAPALRGVFNKASILTQAKGADSVLDAFFKALMQVRFTGRALPNVGVMHPTDWQGVRLLKDSQGRYIMGDPSQPGPSTLFGTPVALGDSFSAGSALVGDWMNFIYLSERRGVEVQVGYSGTQFTEGKKTLRADMRVALTITRAQAFCKITGL